MNENERATVSKIVFTTAEAAEQVGVSMPILLRWVHMDGGIPHFRSSRKILIPRQALIEWVNKQAEMGAVL